MKNFMFILILILILSSCTNDIWGLVGPVDPDWTGAGDQYCWRNDDLSYMSAGERLKLCGYCHTINKPSL
jgi:hypothetical protein